MKKNEKAFTLIELLAVIVILAVLLSIVIPKVSQYITNSRKDGYVATANEIIDGVRNSATSEIYDLPVGTDDITIVSIDLIKLEKGKKKSPFSGAFLDKYSYVAIINAGTDEEPDYEYFIALRDSKRYTISLMREEDIVRNSIIRNNTSGTKAPITSMCGSVDGEYKVINKIIGLEDYQPTNGWNAIVYSSMEC